MKPNDHDQDDQHPNIQNGDALEPASNAEGTTDSLKESADADNLEQNEVNEFLGALSAAEAGPSTQALAIMHELARYHSRLPVWRKVQLAKAGYHGEQDKPVKLAFLIESLLQLASIKHDGRVNLSQEEAADACHVSKARAFAWLHLLESAGVLRCVQRGSWQRKLSTTYEFGSASVNGNGSETIPF